LLLRLEVCQDRAGEAGVQAGQTTLDLFGLFADNPF
jgi:hypothetical protein